MLRAATAAVLAGSALWWYATGVEPRRLELVRVKVPVQRLPGAFHGLTIGQLSDLHLGPYVGPAQVSLAMDLLLDQRPDIVVVTGDFVTSLENGEADQVAQVLSRLAAPLGVFAILGNHDYWTNATVVVDAIDRSGVRLLRNAHAVLERSGELLYLAGVDDHWEQHDDLAAALRGIPAEGRAILLAHEPDFADQAARDPRVALQISGHSHGGQVRLPAFGTLHYPPFARKYGEGLHWVGGMPLYGNRGVGLVYPPIRFNCPPEVTVFELTSV